MVVLIQENNNKCCIIKVLKTVAVINYKNYGTISSVRFLKFIRTLTTSGWARISSTVGLKHKASFKTVFIVNYVFHSESLFSSKH